jgi:hypothetical protein
MAGPLTIQRTAKGLLDFLGMKGLGDGPHECMGAVFPGLDMTWMFLQDRIIQVQPTTAAIGALGFFSGSSAPTTVPAGELWLPVNLSARVTMAVGNSWDWCLSYTRAPGFIYQFSNMQAAAASGVRALGFDFTNTRVMGPGDSLGVYVLNPVVPGTPTVQLALDYYRLLI